MALACFPLSDTVGADHGLGLLPAERPAALRAPLLGKKPHLGVGPLSRQIIFTDACEYLYRRDVIGIVGFTLEVYGRAEVKVAELTHPAE
jgi:hypothetical protein